MKVLGIPEACENRWIVNLQFLRARRRNKLVISPWMLCRTPGEEYQHVPDMLLVFKLVGKMSFSPLLKIGLNRGISRRRELAR